VGYDENCTPLKIILLIVGGETMKESIHFSYDGITSEQMGLLNVRVDTSGFYEEQFLADRELYEISIRGNERPYFQGIKRAPLTLSLSFAFEDTYDEAKIREVARWLNAEYYKPFFTLDAPDRIYYCMLTSSSKLLHNGLLSGYITIEMRCDSPYTYTPQYLSPLYDYSTNVVNGTNLTFTNFGDTICRPEVWIVKVGDGDVSIINNTDGGREFKFTGLSDGETVYVSSEREHIETDKSNTYRYDNFNDNYLKMVRGVNSLVVKGNCKVQFRYTFSTLQG
jgi:phage-related protein